MPCPPRWSIALVGAVVALLSCVAPAAATSSQLAAASDDPVYVQGLQWGLDAIGAPRAWATSRGEGMTIAIVDSGIDLQHEDLASKLVPGISCIGTAGDPGKCRGSAQDDNGHGTHVAGIAAAATDNGHGIAGVAPDARLMPVRVLSNDCSSGTCTASGTAGDVAAGIRWATAHGADIINLSLGGGTLQGAIGCAFCDAIDEAWSKGVIAVIAAGNDSVLPAGFGDEPAVVVTATSRNDERASYSNATAGILRSARWPVAAPGGEGETSASDCATGGRPKGVLSTYWIAGHANEYACLAGTSMAAPHVAGGLALLRSAGLAPQAAVDRLLATADDLGAPGRDPAFGVGRVDVAAAVGAPGTTTTARSTSTSAAAAPDSRGAATPTTTEATTAPAPAGTEPEAVPVPSSQQAATFTPQPISSRQPGGLLVAVAVAALLATATATAAMAWRVVRTWE